MPVPLVCPWTKEPLESEGEVLIARISGRHYPVLDGIPILLPSEMECQQVCEAEWKQKGGKESPLSFYNRASNYEQFCREELNAERAAITTLGRAAPVGPYLEIGTGRGVLQGIGADYVALDYSLAALQAFISESHQRVCGKAEMLPFPEAGFTMVYSVAALEHVPEPDRAFEEIHRVLMPGGAVFLAPAWHRVQDNCEGIPLRPYADLSFRQKMRKATLPIRSGLAWKALTALPLRIVRRAIWAMGRKRPTILRFKKLRPNYSQFLMSDSDAVSRLDSHEGALFFHSRGYRVQQPGEGWFRQITAGHASLIAWKPE